MEGDYFCSKNEHVVKVHLKFKYKTNRYKKQGKTEQLKLPDFVSEIYWNVLAYFMTAMADVSLSRIMKIENCRDFRFFLSFHASGKIFISWIKRKAWKNRSDAEGSESSQV